MTFFAGSLLSMATVTYATPVLNNNANDSIEDVYVTPKNDAPYYKTYSNYANSGAFLYVATGNNLGNFAQATEDKLSAFLGYKIDLVESAVSFTPVDGGKSGTWATNINSTLIDFYVVKAGDAYAMYEVSPADNNGSWSTYDLWKAGYGGKDGIEISHFTGYGHNAPVPEPGTMVLFGAGLLGLAIFGKRRMDKE